MAVQKDLVKKKEVKNSSQESSSQGQNDLAVQLMDSRPEAIQLQQLQTLSEKSQQTSGVSQLQEMADQFNSLDQSSEHQENSSNSNNSTIQRKITLEGFQESTKEKRKKRGAGVKKIDALVWKYEKVTEEGADAQEKYSTLVSIEKLITNWNEKHKKDWTGGRVKKLETYLKTIASEKDHVKSEIRDSEENNDIISTSTSIISNYSKPQGVNDIEEGIGSFDQQDIETSMKSQVSPKKKKTGDEKLKEKKDKGLGKSLKGVVMNIQKHHGQMDQFDTFIKGDAAVNSYYSDAAEKVESGDETTALYEQAKGTYLSKMHNKVLNTKEKGFKKSKLKNYKNSSLRDAKKSDTLLAKAKDADGMAQAYYVRHYELGNTRKNLAKREGEVHHQLLNRKAKLRKEQRANYVDAKDLLYEVRDNRKKMQERRDGLRAEGRVVSIGGAIWNAVKFGTVAGGIKFLSFGTTKFVPKKDGRGKVSDEKFDLDLETGKSERRIDDGPWVQSLAHQMKDIMAEFKAKIKKRSKTIWGKISAVLGSFKKFVELARGVFSATATWLGGLSILLPPMATIFAPISAFLSWLSSLFKGINIGATALKLVADGIANLTNTDPSLFTELRGELYGSVAKSASEGASLGANQAWSESRKTLNNRNQGEYVQSDLDRIRNGHDDSVKMELDKTTVIDKESPANNNLFGHKYESRISKTGLGGNAPKGELERFESMSAKDQEAELISINDEINRSEHWGGANSVSEEELNQLKLKKNLYENYEKTNRTGADIGHVIGDVTTDIGSDVLLNVLPTVGNESMDRNDVNYNQDYDGQQTGKNTKGQKEINIKDAAKRERLKNALRTLEEKGHEKAKGLQDKLNLFKPLPSLPELSGASESDKKARNETNNRSKEMTGVINKGKELAEKGTHQ